MSIEENVITKVALPIATGHSTYELRKLLPGTDAMQHMQKMGNIPDTMFTKTPSRHLYDTCFICLGNSLN